MERWRGLVSSVWDVLDGGRRSFWSMLWHNLEEKMVDVWMARFCRSDLTAILLDMDMRRGRRGTYCALAALLAHRQDHLRLDLRALVRQACLP